MRFDELERAPRLCETAQDPCVHPRLSAVAEDPRTGVPADRRVDAESRTSDTAEVV
jgi:hypothetical protein